MCLVNKLGAGERMDLKDPALDQHFIGHKGPVTSLSFSPSDKQLLSSSTDKSFMNWNLLSSSGSLKYKAKNLPITHVTFSPNGLLIASSQGQFVRLWMSNILGKSIEFRAHFSTVRSVEFSPDSDHLLTASDDKNLKIWKTAKRKFVTSLSGHTNWVKFAGFSPQGNLVVSCSDDKTVRLWDPRNAKQVHRFNEVRGVPRHVRFHPSGSCVGVAMSTDVAKIYDIRAMKLLQYYPCHEGPVNSLAFHPSGKYMLTGGKDKTCKIIDLLEGRPTFSLEAHTEPVTAVAFSHSGDNFASGSEDANVLVWKSNLEARNSTDNRTLQESFSVSKLESPKSLKPSRPIVKIDESPIRVIYSAKDYEDSCSELSEDECIADESRDVINKQQPAFERRDNVRMQSFGNDDPTNKNTVPCVAHAERPLSETLENLIASIQSMNDEIKKMNKRVGELERSRRCNCCGCT
ncbi:Hypothetical protein NTJ_12106 [Nesidiocoris tenuis]|uniref:WD repeat-containing protein 55 homolog n=2 Tax=Nesidiocoris tenuis TaxID=355587 RepID=A0ABN7B607_9HEMI|nr:Hypothetical protein NTJ_12106 [Nesidiocoris tenuis]